MTHHHFKAPWGRTLLIISTLTTFVLLGIVVALALGQHQPWFISLPHLPRTLAIAAVLLVPLGALPFIIRGYTITQDGILIRRLWWNTVLPFADIRAVEAEPLALSSCFRTCGNGGMYSFTGYYWSKQLGHFRAYVTDLNRTVIVRMTKRTAVLSPDDPEAFARTVTSHLHRPLSDAFPHCRCHFIRHQVGLQETCAATPPRQSRAIRSRGSSRKIPRNCLCICHPLRRGEAETLRCNRQHFRVSRHRRFRLQLDGFLPSSIR